MGVYERVRGDTSACGRAARGVIHGLAEISVTDTGVGIAAEFGRNALSASAVAIFRKRSSLTT